jgi:hypothetical protein
MKRLGLLAVLAAIAVGTGEASARVTYGTTFDDEFDFSTGLGRASVAGTLESERRRCLRDRVVRMVAITDDGPEIFSVDRSSHNGFFGGSGTISSTQADGMRVHTPAKRLGRKKRCGKASFTVF